MFQCLQVVKLKSDQGMDARIYKAGERGVVVGMNEERHELAVLFSCDMDALKKDIEGGGIGAFEDGSCSVDIGFCGLPMDWFEPVYDEEYLKARREA